MLQNNNGAVVKHLAKASLKNNKLKNILCGIIITIATCLLVVSGVIAYNASKYLESGYSYHGIYINCSKFVFDQLSKDIEIEKIGASKNLGTVKNGVTSMKIMYSDSDVLELWGSSIVEGTLPKNLNEIVLEKDYLKAIGMKKNLGDIITLPYYSINDKQTYNIDFKICGFVKMPQTGQKHRTFFTGITSYEFAMSNDSYSSDVMLRISNSENYSNKELKCKVHDIAASYGIEKQNVIINDYYIDGTNASIESIAGVLLIAVIVLGTSFLVIYSIFYISIATKVRQYGQFRTLGTTKKQIKKIISSEGRILSIIYIPIGIATGLIIAYFVDHVIWIWKADIAIACIMGIFTFMAVQLALLKPMNIAAAISPIEAADFNQYTLNKKDKKRSTERLTPYNLGVMNLKRNTKKTVLTLFSLILSGTLFIAVFSFTNSIHIEGRVKEDFPYGGLYKIAFNYNLLLRGERVNTFQVDNPLDETLKNKILLIDGVDQVKAHKLIPVQITVPSGEMESTSISNITEDEVKKYHKFLIEGTANYATIKASNAVIVNNRDWLKKVGLKFHAGDKISLLVFDGDKKVKKQFNVIGVIENNNIGSSFFMTDEVMDNLVDVNCNLSFEIMSKQGNLDTIANSLSKLIEKNNVLYLDTFEAKIDLYKMAFGIYNTIAHVFVGLIVCFGLINLINTLITNVLSRKREFGLLRAIGMTNKQLMKMLDFENITFLVVTIVFSSLLGYSLGYLICRWVKNTGIMPFVSFEFSLLPLVLIMIVMLIIEFVISIAANNYFSKETVVESLRQNE